MSNIFFTSDLHFGHKKLCTELRGMSDNESAELIRRNWNRVVAPTDKVYILGDVTMSNPREVECLRHLNGTKIVIGGNHDVERCCKVMSDLDIIVMGCLEYKNFIVTHIPIHPLELTRYRGNIHGHIHIGVDEEQGFYDSKMLGKGYYNVNTEFHDYTPVLFEDILAEFEKITIGVR